MGDRGLAHRGLGAPMPAWRVLGALLCGLFAIAIAAAPAAAQIAVGGVQKQNPNAPIALRADQVEYAEDLALMIARGHVEISQNGEVLLADTVTYNQRTDTI
ncbi:MAG: hypothetical protein ACREEZ_05180, partial [Stellaceae bacterium]